MTVDYSITVSGNDPASAAAAVVAAFRQYAGPPEETDPPDAALVGAWPSPRPPTFSGGAAIALGPGGGIGGRNVRFGERRDRLPSLSPREMSDYA